MGAIRNSQAVGNYTMTKVSGLTSAELRQELESRGARTDGRYHELVRRLDSLLEVEAQVVQERSRVEMSSINSEIGANSSFVEDSFQRNARLQGDSDGEMYEDALPHMSTFVET